MKIKNAVKMFVVSLFSLQILSACNSVTSLSELAPLPQNNIKAQSFGGVYTEIEQGIIEAFYSLDEDGNGGISPSEYGVETAANLVSFREADLNADGNVTIFELMPDEMTKLNMTEKLKETASKVFKRLDLSPKDNKLSHKELTSGIVSHLFEDFFLDYDIEKDPKSLNYLTISEFQNEYAYIAANNFPNDMGEVEVFNPKAKLKPVKKQAKKPAPTQTAPVVKPAPPAKTTKPVSKVTKK